MVCYSGVLSLLLPRIVRKGWSGRRGCEDEGKDGKRDAGGTESRWRVVETLRDFPGISGR